MMISLLGSIFYMEMLRTQERILELEKQTELLMP